MRRTALATGLMLLFLAACGGGSSPTEPQGVAPGTASYRVLLYGFPTGGGSTAISKATVKLQGKTGTTNELGKVQFDGLTPGDATVTFEANGWATRTDQIRLAEGMNVFSTQLQRAP
ncbi:MAG TPA: carboxypeptidase regulatory-like domain-containing protein [Thermoanaerobaculia bacterium]|jgi:ABC-type glycerol-3-phosphate transport system substrate-binding protein